MKGENKVHIAVVMQSFLGAYKTAADWRERKIHRAIDSYFNQLPGNYTSELIVVADGCELTAQIIANNYAGYPIRLISIEKQPIWSGIPRTIGIKEAQPGSWITYLDIDDYLGEEHLKTIAEAVAGTASDWVWFNNHVLDNYPRPTEQNNSLELARCGTCNIAHRSSIDKLWQVKADYLHDWNAIQNLKREYPNYSKIETPAYIVCHLPNMIDL